MRFCGRFYLENKTLEKIAVDLYISYPHIKRLKRFGIEKICRNAKRNEIMIHNDTITYAIMLL